MVLLLQLMALQHKELVEEVVLTLMFQIMVEQVEEVNLIHLLLEEQDVQEQLIQVEAVEVVHTVTHLVLMVALAVQE